MMMLCDGCILCKGYGCDDCMFETRAWEYYFKDKPEPYIKRNVLIKSDDKRLRSLNYETKRKNIL